MYQKTEMRVTPDHVSHAITINPPLSDYFHKLALIIGLHDLQMLKWWHNFQAAY